MSYAGDVRPEADLKRALRTRTHGRSSEAEPKRQSLADKYAVWHRQAAQGFEALSRLGKPRGDS